MDEAKLKELAFKEIALAFTRECLGLESFPAESAEPGEEVIITVKPGGKKKLYPFTFYYGNIADVLEAARGWCEKWSYCWSLGSADETSRVQATIYTDGEYEITTPWIMEHGELDQNPCYALLSACVAAHRHMETVGAA